MSLYAEREHLTSASVNHTRNVGSCLLRNADDVKLSREWQERLRFHNCTHLELLFNTPPLPPAIFSWPKFLADAREENSQKVDESRVRLLWNIGGCSQLFPVWRIESPRDFPASLCPHKFQRRRIFLFKERKQEYATQTTLSLYFLLPISDNEWFFWLKGNRGNRPYLACSAYPALSSLRDTGQWPTPTLVSTPFSVVPRAVR